MSDSEVKGEAEPSRKRAAEEAPVEISGLSNQTAEQAEENEAQAAPAEGDGDPTAEDGAEGPPKRKRRRRGFDVTTPMPISQLPLVDEPVKASAGVAALPPPPDAIRAAAQQYAQQMLLLQQHMFAQPGMMLRPGMVPMFPPGLPGMSSAPASGLFRPPFPMPPAMSAAGNLPVSAGLQVPAVQPPGFKAPAATPTAAGAAAAAATAGAAALARLAAPPAELRAYNLMSRLYVGSIPFDKGEEDVRPLFICFGIIRNINISWDAALGKHKGFAFVEFDTPEACQLALNNTSGYQIAGRPLKVGRPNNAPQAMPLVQKMAEDPRNAARIYIANIHPKIAEADVRAVFEAFGTISGCKMCPDPTVCAAAAKFDTDVEEHFPFFSLLLLCLSLLLLLRFSVLNLRPFSNPRQDSTQHAGYGFLDYEEAAAAADAVRSMNMFDLAGQVLHVCQAITLPEFCSFLSGTAPTPVIVPAAAAAKAAEVVAKAGIMPQAAAATAAIAAAALRPGLTEQHITSLQQEDNLQISGSTQRYMMMQKLARKEESRSKGGDDSGVILLKNMIGPAELDSDFEDEVRQECSKFGAVRTVVIHVEPNPLVGPLLFRRGKRVCEPGWVLKEGDLEPGGGFCSFKGRGGSHALDMPVVTQFLSMIFPPSFFTC